MVFGYVNYKILGKLNGGNALASAPPRYTRSRGPKGPAGGPAALDQRAPMAQQGGQWVPGVPFFLITHPVRANCSELDHCYDIRVCELQNSAETKRWKRSGLGSTPLHSIKGPRRPSKGASGSPGSFFS